MCKKSTQLHFIFSTFSKFLLLPIALAAKHTLPKVLSLVLSIYQNRETIKQAFNSAILRNGQGAVQ